MKKIDCNGNSVSINTNTNTNVDKVLVVVDVQNCFIAGGSLSFSTMNKTDPSYLPKLSRSINQINQIVDLIDKNNNIIFTRDYHPINHYSLKTNKKNQNYLGVFPTHCRNNSRKCEEGENTTTHMKTTNNITNKKTQTSLPQESITINKVITKLTTNILASSTNTNTINTSIKAFIEKNISPDLKSAEILGTNLSYLYYFTKYAKQIHDLITKPEYEYIGLYPTKKVIDNGINHKNNHRLINMNSEKIYKPDGKIVKFGNKDKKIIQLTKGQYCMYEAYSAFNYQVRFKKTAGTGEKQGKIIMEREDMTNPKMKETPEKLKERLKKYSTGLFEYILKQNNKKIIEISVCGLVGEICVIHTILQGLVMWNKVYKKDYPDKKIIFNYYLQGTIFLAVYSPFTDKPVPDVKSENDKNIFLNNLIQVINDLVTNKVFSEEYLNLINFNVFDYKGDLIGSINSVTSSEGEGTTLKKYYPSYTRVMTNGKIIYGHNKYGILKQEKSPTGLFRGSL